MGDLDSWNFSLPDALIIVEFGGSFVCFRDPFAFKFFLFVCKISKSTKGSPKQTQKSPNSRRFGPHCVNHRDEYPQLSQNIKSKGPLNQGIHLKTIELIIKFAVTRNTIAINIKNCSLFYQPFC